LESRYIEAGWKLIDLIFPPCCAGCGKWGERYCQNCIGLTKRIKPPLCQACGEPVDDVLNSVCQRCQSDTIYFSAVRSWAIFEEPLKTAIHNLKYNRDIGLGGFLAKPLASMLVQYDWEIDLIAAVPLDAKRKKQRGYNQSVLLARPLAWMTGIEFNQKILSRSRCTLPQVGLSRKERNVNLVGAFSSDSAIVEGKTILVVDDVVTTGSTLNECSRTLLDSGAKGAYGLTLARSSLL